MRDSQSGRSVRLQEDARAPQVPPTQKPVDPPPSATQQTAAIQRRLHTINPQAIAASHRKKRRLIYIAFAACIVGVLAYIGLSFVPGLKPIVSQFRYALLLAPICTVLALKEFSRKLARSHPIAAQRMCAWLTLGQVPAICHVASMYMDSGNFTQAEKILSQAAKAVKPSKLNDYIIIHAFLAVARTGVGKMAQGQNLIAETIQTAETLYQSRPTPSSAVVLAIALNNGAEIAAEERDFEFGSQFTKRAVELLADLKDPPIDTLLSCLTNAGHFANASGQSGVALAYLTKARELVENTDDCRLTCAASVYANLGFSHAIDDDYEASAQALGQAITYLGSVAARKELPAVHRTIAQVHASAGQTQEATAEYESAIRASQLFLPKQNYTTVFLQEEFAGFLRTIGREGAGAAAQLQAMQLKASLDKDDAAPAQNKPQLKQEAVKLAKSKGRFPIFCLLATLLYGFLVYQGGVRVASFSTWVWFIGFFIVTAIKLRAKYGQASSEETHSAIVAIAAHVPFARYIVPELAVLPQRTAIAFLAVAAVLVGAVKISQPAPNTVPESGLTAYEYCKLGRRLIEENSFNKAALAYNRALAIEPKGRQADIANFARLHDLPKYPQPDEAIAANQRASNLRRKDPAQAIAIWQECTQKYPNFEMPFAHLAETYVTKKDEGKLKQADELATKALEINPDSYQALLAMFLVKSSEHDPSAGEYNDRMTDAIADDTATGSAVKGLFGGLRKVEKDLHR